MAGARELEHAPDRGSGEGSEASHLRAEGGQGNGAEGPEGPGTLGLGGPANVSSRRPPESHACLHGRWESAWGDRPV
eukprot:8101681-Alexandrium_andersonii.AAC.1